MARRTRLTRPYPIHALEDALPIAETIQNVNGGQPVAPEPLAKSLGTTPKSSAFVQKLKSSAGYGLTVGSHTSERVEVTPLGESLTAPRDESERADALRAAALAPEVFSRFFDMYAGKRFPEDEFASNALVRDVGIHPDLAEECLRTLRRNALFAGLATERADGLYVDWTEPPAPDNLADTERAPSYNAFGNAHGNAFAAGSRPVAFPDAPRPPAPSDSPHGARRGANGHDAAAQNADAAPPNAGPENAPATALIVARSGDPLAEAVSQIMTTLSLPVTDVDLSSPSPRPVPEEMSDALRSARGCVVVWPSGDLSDGDRRFLRVRAWMALGAASHLLGEKALVVGDAADDAELAAASESLDLTVIDASDAAGVYPALMGALIAKSVVQVSWG